MKERIRTKKQRLDIKKATICLLIVISFLISVTAAATDHSIVKHKKSHHKVAKKVKTELDPDPDPAIIASGPDPISPSLGN